MTVTCKLTDYGGNSSDILDRPKVIIKEGEYDRRMVRITIDGKTAEVAADELHKAIDACTGLPL